VRPPKTVNSLGKKLNSLPIRRKSTKTRKRQGTSTGAKIKLEYGRGIIVLAGKRLDTREEGGFGSLGQKITCHIIFTFRRESLLSLLERT